MFKTKLGKVVAALGLLVTLGHVAQASPVLGKAQPWVALGGAMLAAAWLYLSNLLAKQDPPDA